jgi:HK97 family phage portal protein
MFDFGEHTRADGDIVAPQTDVTLSSSLGLFDRNQPTEQQIRRELRGTLEACLRKRAELFARSCTPGGERQGLMVKRETADGMEPVEDDHPWLRLLRQPNKHRSAYIWYYWTRFAADVQGSASHVVRDDGLGTPEALLEVFPSFGRMREKINREGGPAGYVYRKTDGRREDLGPEDVVQVKRIDPTTPHGTMSILESLAHEVSSDRAAAEFRQKSYSEGRPPMMYLSTEDNIGAKKAREQGQRFKSTYMAPNGDVKGVPVFHGGMEPGSLGIDPDSYQMLESQELDHDVIFRVTGINSALMDQGSNRAEAEQAERSVLKMTIQPLLNQVAAQLTMSLRRAFGAEDTLRVVAPNVAPKTAEEQEQIAEKRIARGVPPAEVMRERGEEVPDEHEETLDQPYLPKQLTPAGSGAPARGDVGDFL